MEIKTRKKSLRTKMVIIGGLVSLILLGFTNILAIKQVDKNLIEIMQKQTLETSNIVASMVDGDKHAAIEGEDSEYYGELKELFKKFINGGTIQYVYTVVKGKAVGSGFAFGVDGDSEEPAKYGDTFDSEAALKKAFEGTPAVTGETKDEWGKHITAYVPVLDSNNKVIAVVGVDCSVSNIDKSVVAIKKDLITVSIFMFVVSMFIFAFFANGISKAVRKVYHTIFNITETDGNLVDRIYIHSGDELELLAKTINKFLDKMQGVIKETKTIGDKVSYKSMSIRANSSTDKERIAAVSGEMQSIEETMAGVRSSISEILEHTTEILENAQNMEQVSLEEIERIAKVNAKAYSLKNASLRAKEDAMELLNNIKVTLYERMEKMKSVKEINKLTNDIAEVAEQTKLLALNASIEAARAGESGKGFTVVATEISSLADNTDNTANKISEMNQVVSDSTQSMIDAVQTLLQYLENTVMDDYNSMIAIGNDYDEDAGAFKKTMMKFNSMVEVLNNAVEEITGLVDNAAGAINDSFDHINEIAQATKKINDTSNVTNNLIAETGSEIENLKKKLSYFKTEEGLFNRDK